MRLPAVRSRIAAWRAAQGLPPLPPLDPPAEVLAEADSGGEVQVQQLMAQLRCGDIYKRGLAAGAINDMMIEWGHEPVLPARQQAMEVGRGGVGWICGGGVRVVRGTLVCLWSGILSGELFPGKAADWRVCSVQGEWDSRSAGRQLSAIASLPPCHQSYAHHPAQPTSSQPRPPPCCCRPCCWTWCG